MVDEKGNRIGHILFVVTQSSISNSGTHVLFGITQFCLPSDDDLTTVILMIKVDGNHRNSNFVLTWEIIYL